MSGARWIVMRREVTERLRSRAFRIGTAIQLAAVVVLLVVAAVTSGGTDTKTVALVGPASAPYAQPLAAAGPALDARIRTRTLPDRAAAVRAVRDEDVDAAVVAGREVLVKDDARDALAAVVQQTHRQLALRAALEGAGVRGAALQRALDPAPLTVRALDPASADQEERRGLAFIAVLLLYLAIFGYGLTIASGVVEEKASRVIEVVVSAIPPRELLAGKIIGHGLLGVGQFALTVAVGVGGARLIDAIDLPSLTVGWGLLVALWFAIGYALYACAYATGGALVSRQEDIGATTGALNFVVIGAYILVLIAIQDPDGTLLTVLSFAPPSAPMAMPARWLLTDVPAWQLALSVALSLAAIVALLRLATVVYAASALRLGPKLSLRQALAGRRR